MTSFTVDITDEKLCAALREQAKQNGRSVEEEIIMQIRYEFPRIRETKPNDDGSEKGVGTAIHEYFADLGGIELNLPPGGPGREPPTFE